jgi:hypothetical protein
MELALSPINAFNELQYYMLAGMYLLGGVTFITGVIILLVGIWGYDQQALLAQTNRIAQKGLTEELSGLVGNASTLLSTLNDMVRTRNGIGFILIFTGGLLMVTAYWFTQNSPGF